MVRLSPRTNGQSRFTFKILFRYYSSASKNTILPINPCILSLDNAFAEHVRFRVLRERSRICRGLGTRNGNKNKKTIRKHKVCIYCARIGGSIGGC